jgi:phage terminase large subunit-like protein
MVKHGPPKKPRVTDAEKQRRGTFQPVLATHKPRRAVKKIPKAPARDYLAIAEAYMADVLKKRVPACTWVRLAIKRQQADRARPRSWPYGWSDAHAIDACAFVERIPHVEGQWETPTIQLEPAQVFLVTCLFGWRQKSNPARRRFTVLYWELGRKGAKSTLMAAIALYHIAREQEPGAQVVCGATTGSQARIVFGIAQKMVKASRWLRYTEGFEALANAVVTKDGAMKPVNAKASTQDGLNPSCIVLDESHAQKFALHDVLKSAQGARPNPLLLCPTTAGYDLLSVGYALRSTLMKVLHGVIEADHFLGAICTLDDGDDWRDPAVWVKANPMLGVTPRREWVERYCGDAQQTPGLEGEFRVKVCSEWLQSAKTWLSMTRWDACAEPTLRLEQFAGQRCWMGGDLAQRDDLAAIALLFERDPDIVGFVRFYLPELVVRERARAVPEYDRWVQAGLLTLTEGNMIDLNHIEADVRAWCKSFDVQALRFDQFGSSHIVSALERDGFPAAILDKNRKSMTPPARELETRVKHGRFKHDGNSCLKWMASNTVVTRGIDDSILPKKEHADSPNKIDGIDAILQAMSAMIIPAEPEKSYQILVYA